jgi:hypothetical protein
MVLYWDVRLGFWSLTLGWNVRLRTIHSDAFISVIDPLGCVIDAFSRSRPSRERHVVRLEATR